MNHYLLKATGLILVVASLLCPSSLWAQDHKVSGTIVDETGAPMISMAVVVTGTTTGAITDMDGHYEIAVPADGSLTFSYLGYLTQEVQVGGRSVINITMQPDSELLSDAIVIGYGTTTKRTSPDRFLLLAATTSTKVLSPLRNSSSTERFPEYRLSQAAVLLPAAAPSESEAAHP